MLCLLDNTKIRLQICQLETIRVSGEVDLGEPPGGKETMAPSFVLMLPSGTVVDPLQNTPTCLSSIPDLVSDVPMDEPFVAPVSVQTSPRELTRSQGELV